MKSYYGYTLSPNQLETGEGFLICKNVPIARTGDQEYLGQEIGLKGPEAGKIVKVFRPPEEVFSDAALASFEGKPVTNDHPPDLLTPEDATTYSRGHVQNIRPGKGEWEGYMLGDLHIQDRELIDAIQSGKREISAGYECEYIDNGDGTYTQRNIRGNHVAVVDRARAGKRAAILDSKYTAVTPPEREKISMKHTFLQLFGLAAKDKTPDEIAKLAMDAAEAMEAEEKPTKDEPYKEKLYEPIDKGDMNQKPSEDALDAMIEKLASHDGFLEKIMAKIAEKKAMEEEEDPMDEMIEKLTGGEAEVQSDEEARTVPAEEMDTSHGMDKALAAAILKSMRPTVANIKDAKQRKAVSDALIKCVTTNDGASDIAKIIRASQSAASKAADRNPQADMEALQDIYRSRNPHTRKENR